MKSIPFTIALCCLLASCGNNDKTNYSKQENENYPTYDTASRIEHVNDSVSNGGMRSGGKLNNSDDEHYDGD